MRNFKVIGFILLATLGTLQAQSEIKVNDKVSLKGDCDINFLLDAHYDKNKNCNVADGYRVQIINSSNREEVYAKKAEVYAHFMEFKGYIVYDQPYYKLRVGDFQTKLDARKYLNQIITLFPTAFLVMDEIKIK
jgi:hypothetical protein